MQIIVKNPDINVLNSYIKKGADAFLFGIKGFSINNKSALTMTALTIMNNNFGKGDNIFVLIDKNFNNSELKSLEKLLIKLDKMNLAGVFYHDIAVLNIVKRLDLNISLIWDQDFMATNYETINYYASKGIKGVVLATVITTDSIIDISKKTNTSLFVNIFGYQLTSYSKRKLLTNYFKNYKMVKGSKNYSLTDEVTKKSYPIVENNEGTMIYSNNILNGIMEINRLKEAKVNYIIMDEYLIQHYKFMNILEMYLQSVKKDLDDGWLRTYNMEIKKNYKNMDDGFFNKETIYKVK